MSWLMGITTLESTPPSFRLLLSYISLHPALPYINQPKSLTAIEIYRAVIISIFNVSSVSRQGDNTGSALQGNVSARGT